MTDDLHITVKHILEKCVDIFPEGSALYKNTRSAIRNIDEITDGSGTMFTSCRMKFGIETILSEALGCLDDNDSYLFLHDEIARIRDYVQTASVSDQINH